MSSLFVTILVFLAVAAIGIGLNWFRLKDALDVYMRPRRNAVDGKEEAVPPASEDTHTEGS